eukprot:EG_transcript_19508
MARGKAPRKTTARPDAAAGKAGKDAAAKSAERRPKGPPKPKAEEEGTSGVVFHRKLKFHEQKLLRQHGNFVHWKMANENKNEAFVVKRFLLEDREDYRRYNMLATRVKALVHTLKFLPPDSKVRLQITKELLEKLYNMGVIRDQDNLSSAEKIGVSHFCGRRLASMLVNLKMAPSMLTAVQFVKHGHIRVGPDRISDPAYLVPRKLEDFVTWALHSKIRQKVLEYNQTYDDFELHN